MSRFIVIDTELQTLTGHNYNSTNRVVRSALTASFDDVLVGANIHFGPKPNEMLGQDDPRVVVDNHFFSYGYDLWQPGQYRPLPDPSLAYREPYSAASFHYELEAFVKKHDVASDDIVYLHTFTMPIALGLLKFLRARNFRNLPKFHLLVYMAPDKLQLQEISKQKFAGLLERLAYAGVLGDRVHVHVETRGLQEAYREFGYEFPVLMGPIPEGVSSAPRDKKRLTVGYLGEARAEKGFGMVPDILTAFFTRAPEAAAKVDIVVQVKSNPGNANDEWVVDGRRKLQELAKVHRNVTLVEDLSAGEYGDLLERLDVALLPYHPDTYRRRGSGVAYEALAHDAWLLVSGGTDIAQTFAFPNTVSVAHYDPDAFARALLEMLEAVPKGYDRAPAKAFLDQFRESGFVATMLQTAVEEPVLYARAPEGEALVPSPKRPKLLLLCCATLEGGVGMVQRTQIDTFDAMGFDVYCAFLPWPSTGIEASHNTGLVYDRIDTRRHDWLLNARHGFFCFVPFESSKRSAQAERMFVSDRFQPHTVHSYAERMAFLDSESAAPLIAGRHFERVVVNYPFYVPALASLKVTYDRLVVETHDLQAKQMYFRRAEKKTPQPEFVEYDLRLEVKLAQKADALVHISSDLSQYFAVGERQPQHYVARPPASRPILDAAVSTAAQLETVTTVHDLVRQAHQTDREFVDKCSHIYHNPRLDSVDLLFAGSEHPSNVHSLRYFIDKVFLPFLYPYGVKLYVAGTICRALRSYEKYIALLGRVDRIVPLTMAAKVNLLPVIEGTGFPTKVLETLSMGQAFAVSRYAFYELHEDAAAYFPVLDTAQEWLVDTLALLVSREEREARARAGWEFAQQHFNRQSYADTWAQALDYAGAPKLPDEAFLGHQELRGGGEKEDNRERDLVAALDGEMFGLLRDNRPDVASRLAHVRSQESKADSDLAILKRWRESAAIGKRTQE